MPSDDVIALKDAGAKALEVGDLEGAEKYYAAALDGLLLGDVSSRCSTDQDFAGALLSNLSLVHLRLGDAQLALRDASDVIRLRPSWCKGFYRKSCALLALMRCEDNVAEKERYRREADVALHQTLAFDPTNIDVIRLLDEVRVGATMCPTVTPEIDFHPQPLPQAVSSESLRLPCVVAFVGKGAMTVTVAAHPQLTFGELKQLEAAGSPPLDALGAPVRIAWSPTHSSEGELLSEHPVAALFTWVNPKSLPSITCCNTPPAASGGVVIFRADGVPMLVSDVYALIDFLNGLVELQQDGGDLSSQERIRAHFLDWQESYFHLCLQPGMQDQNPFMVPLTWPLPK